MEPNSHRVNAHSIKVVFVWAISIIAALSSLRIGPDLDPQNLLHVVTVWVLFAASASFAFCLLYVSSKNMRFAKYWSLCIAVMVIFVLGFHIFIAIWPDLSPRTWYYLMINPQPMAWLLLSVATICASAALASRGVPYVFLNRIRARLERKPLGRRISRPDTAGCFLANIRESWLACFWIVYLWAIYNQATGQLSVQDWDLWTGWPMTLVAVSLLFGISFFAFADILAVADTCDIISLKRYSANWTLSAPALLGFVVTMYVLLKENPHEYLAFLWFVVAFTSALSLGFSLSLEALRDSVFRRAHGSHWYYSLQLDQ
jgi:cytochrome bd-type quinol oxidase subunit 2